MEFFLYGAKPGQDEAAYTALVGEGKQGEPGKRIAKIHFTHNGDEFEAEVGKCLQRKERYWQQDDPAIVMAILPGDPWDVHTTAGIMAGPEGRSRWANPFLVGNTSILKSWTFDELE